MGIKHTYKATGTDDPTKQVSVNRWNEDHVIDSEVLATTLDNDPVNTPADYSMYIYGKRIAGRAMLCQKGPSGQSTSFQANLGGNKVALWMPAGNSTSVPGVFGMNALTAVGTATARNVAVTNFATRMTRLGYVSAATAGSLTSLREAAAKYTTGAGGGQGGFFYRCRFIVSDAATVAGARMFVGLSSSTAAATNVEPNTLVNSIGVCKLSTSNNLHIYCAGASANSSPVDLGANFPAHTLSTVAYELIMFSSANGGSVFIQVNNLSNGQVAYSEIPSGYPNSSTLLCHQIWRTNNATALAVGLDLCGLYIETDN